jgi:protein O-GlcNAc transferase
MKWINFIALSYLIQFATSVDQLRCSRSSLDDATEKSTLLRYFQNADFYFEFGAGQSTLLACSTNNIRKIVTVETDPKYIEDIARNSSCVASSLSGRLEPRFIDIGPTVAYGYPADESKKSNWPKYSESILLYSDSLQGPDLVLVDGRFRVAAALSSILSLRINGFILIHDFFTRPHYYEVLKYLDLVDCVDELAVFQPKPDISFKELETDLKHYQMITQ